MSRNETRNMTCNIRADHRVYIGSWNNAVLQTDIPFLSTLIQALVGDLSLPRMGKRWGEG